MEQKPKAKRRYWKHEERMVLLDRFADSYTAELCELLNRSYGSVCSQATLMGLKKSEEFMQRELKLQAERLKEVGIQHRFVKGAAPLNKGVKMHALQYEKCKRTMFKKGHTPHNTNYDGHERISKDGYVEVRTSKGRYVFKHRLVWERENGPVPDGMLVVFKDRNKLNITLDNLELITREENMKRNTIHRFPEELVSTIKVLNKLKRKIYAKEQN